MSSVDVNQLAAISVDYLNQYGVAVGAAILIGTAVWCLTNRKQGEVKVKTREEYVLTKRQQKLQEHTLIADGIAELLLDLFTTGKITSERYQYWHLRFGTQLALKDLLPAKLTPDQIKEALKKRPRVAYKPIPFPKEEAKPKKYKPKNAIDAVLHRHFEPTV